MGSILFDQSTKPDGIIYVSSYVIHLILDPLILQEASSFMHNLDSKFFFTYPSNMCSEMQHGQSLVLCLKISVKERFEGTICRF